MLITTTGGCQELSITGPGFVGGVYSCLFKRGIQRASAPATARIPNLGRVVTCVVPAWKFEAGSVQLILVMVSFTLFSLSEVSLTIYVKKGEFVPTETGATLQESYGPINFRGQNLKQEMFEYLKAWQPLSSNPSVGPSSGGALLGFSTQGFISTWSWYRCVFRRLRFQGTI